MSKVPHVPERGTPLVEHHVNFLWKHFIFSLFSTIEIMVELSIPFSNLLYRIYFWHRRNLKKNKYMVPLSPLSKHVARASNVCNRTDGHYGNVCLLHE